MIKPTTGRVVLFTPAHSNLPQGFLLVDPRMPCSAMVAYVWNDRLVNLTVSDHYGKTFNMTSVPLLQDDDAKPERGYFCAWMEFQKGQAAKYEAAVEAAKHEPTAADRKAMSDIIGDGVDKMAKIAGV